jgi:hypothetical protein
MLEIEKCNPVQISSQYAWASAHAGTTAHQHLAGFYPISYAQHQPLELRLGDGAGIGNRNVEILDCFGACLRFVSAEDNYSRDVIWVQGRKLIGIVEAPKEKMFQNPGH